MPCSPARLAVCSTMAKPRPPLRSNCCMAVRAWMRVRKPLDARWSPTGSGENRRSNSERMSRDVTKSGVSKESRRAQNPLSQSSICESAQKRPHRTVGTLEDREPLAGEKQVESILPRDEMESRDRQCRHPPPHEPRSVALGCQEGGKRDTTT